MAATAQIPPYIHTPASISESKGARILGFTGCFPGVFWLIWCGNRRAVGLGFDASAGSQQQPRQVNPVATCQLFCLSTAAEAVS